MIVHCGVNPPLNGFGIGSLLLISAQIGVENHCDISQKETAGFGDLKPVFRHCNQSI